DRPNAVQTIADDRIEPAHELRDAVDRDREPCGHRVAAVPQEHVVAFGERLGDVDACDRAARALSLEAIDGDDHGGPTVILDQPRRAQADDARGPGGIRDDRDPGVGTLLGAPARARDDLTGELLTFGVAL